MNNGRRPLMLNRRVLCIAMAIILILSLTACGNKDDEPLRATEETMMPTVSIETAYCTLQFPEELFENLRHVEVTEGSIAMEIFYMVFEEGEKELYRIHFADAKMGDHVGYLTTDSGEIPVTYSMCEYADEDFQTEEERKLYHSMMDAFSVIVNAIYADERFSETRVVAPVGDREVKLRYWKVTLPENVQCTETEENDTYRVVFYGEAGGERVNLYAITIGNAEAESQLGFYTIGNEKKPVMVQTYDMDPYLLWSEEEQTVIYRMMESVNTVIQTIMADENFSVWDSAE